MGNKQRKRESFVHCVSQNIISFKLRFGMKQEMLVIKKNTRQFLQNIDLL
jgi:hypothetical protein